MGQQLISIFLRTAKQTISHAHTPKAELMLGLSVNPTVHSASPTSLSAHPMPLHWSMQCWFRYGRWLLILLLILLSVVVLTPLPVHAAEPTFSQTMSFGHFESTFSVAVGDLNGDGFLDIVQGNSGDPSYVYLNNGQGGFRTPALALGEAQNTFSIAVGDLNGDGFLDIIQGNNGTPSYLYLNDGQGGFRTSALALGEAQNTFSVAVGDLNGDGFLDIVQGNRFGDLNDDRIIDEAEIKQGITYLYLNDGQGGFPTPPRAVGGFLNTYSVALGDMNNDGFLDIVQGNNPEDLDNNGTTDSAEAQYGISYLYLNDGQGNFPTPPHAVGGAENTNNVVLGDLNGDGFLDIVQGNNGAVSYVYLNDGQGGFSTPAFVIGDGPASSQVAVGDLNSDGFLDIFLGNSGPPSYLYLNYGYGYGFAAGRVVGGAQRTVSMAMGDFNGDGFLDLVKGNYAESSYLYLNDGPGGFDTVDSYLAGDQRTFSVAVGDLNDDGFLDIVQGNFQEVSYLYLNDGLGGFDSTGQAFGGVQRTYEVLVGDLNGDGFLDLVQGNADAPSYLFLNDGQGGFPGPGRVWGNGDETYSIAMGDFNGDGFLDLVQGKYGVPSYLFLNNGQGGFDTPGYPVGERQWAGSLATGDLNGDGLLDLVQGNRLADFNRNEMTDEDELNSAISYVYLNDGQGGFAPRRALGGIQDTFSVATGDFNGDGFLDIAQGNLGTSYLYLNDGLGGFAAGRPLSLIQNTTNLTVGDVNGDGFLDLIQAYIEIGQNYLYLNDGQGNFGAGRPFGNFQNTMQLALGDLNRDGLLDLVQGNDGQPSLVYLNTLHQVGSLTNHAPQIAVTRPGPTANADFFSTPALLTSPTIPITYTLFDQEGDSVGRMEAAYSLDGGGQWLPAVATQATITQNLTTGRALVQALATPSVISSTGGAPLQAQLVVTPSITLAAVEVWLNVTYTDTADLAITLQSPQGTQVPLVALGLVQGQNLQAMRFSARAVLPISFGTAPYQGTYQPSGDLTALAGEPSNGVWTLVITNTGTLTGTLASWGLQLKSPPATHLFEWDTLASGFFGQSDNVILRLVAYNQPLTTTLPSPGSYHYPHSAAGPYQQPYASATTFPFRVRGTQVRVLDSSGQPAPNALVYRLPRGAVTGAEPMPSAGQPLTTTSNGYLSGRGALAIDDQLVALQPISATHAFTLYYTSAPPTATGLALQPVTQAGVQTLTVSAANPLVLFDLDLTLEWDARNDDLFLEQLDSALARTSAVLFDVSNGQMALGNVRIHQAREQWVATDVVLYASNSIHPRASMGGVVITPTHELGVSGVISNAYLPGQIRLGPNWDPFGQNQAELTEDWSRALAHELAHYLLFLPDNYLGIAENRLRMTNCRGSFMTNAHDAEGYSEFLPRADWQGDCRQTVAERLTGRTDWETILRFFPWLHAPGTAAEAPGPSALPLNLLRISYRPLTQPAVTLPARNYDLRDENGQLLTVQQAQAYLFQSHGTPDLTDDSVIPLGSTGNGSDRIKVRGAAPGDRLCLLAANQTPARLGCRVITPDSGAIGLAPVNDWRPVITVSPITSRTLAITVTQAAPVGPLYVQVLPAYGALTGTALITAPLIFAPWAALPALDPANPVTYTQVITLAYPAFEGFVRVWAPGGEPSTITEREALTQFFLSAAWGPPKSGFGGADTRVWGPPKSGFGGADTRAWGANHRALAAPVASGDGKVTLFNLIDLLGETGVATLQTLANLPQVPLWLTPVGQGYRLTIDADYTLTIAFHYLQREAPAGYEHTLALYYSPDDGATWQRLPTLLDVEENLAAAQVPANDQYGAGLYALMATLAMPALTPGWNQFAYPLPQARPVPVALASLADAYTALYHFDPAAQPIRQAHDKPHWRVYAPAVAADQPALAGFVNDLTTLTFGQSYWLHATAAITPYLGVGGDPSVFAASHATGLELPPAILYGVITVPESTPLAVGTVLTALVDGNPCGQTTVESWQGQLVYKLQVAADTGNGCGIVGRTITLTLQGTTIATAIAWDNRQPVAQSLFLGDAGQRLFLPIVRQGS